MRTRHGKIDCNSTENSEVMISGRHLASTLRIFGRFWSEADMTRIMSTRS